ncbi:MAG: HAMP domain-containing sensor histidine kinase [Pirellulales bacterium]
MMRPWRVWLCFGLSLAVALPALAWLTATTLELERAELSARSQSQREELIRLALWRMDTKLTPLIAREAARPVMAYTSFYSVSTPPGSQTAASAVPSPLLRQPSEFVLLHFEVRAGGRWTSPQRPDPQLNELAVSNGTTLANIRLSDARIGQLQSRISYQQIVEHLPEQSEPPAPVAPPPEALAGDLPLEPFTYPAKGASRPTKGGAKAMAADLVRRQENVKSNTIRELTQQQIPFQTLQSPASPDLALDAGVSRPVWLGDDHLILARRVTVDGEPLVQGCWLDWEKLQASLKSDVADLLPEVRLTPVRGGGGEQPAHLLATLPVRLEVPALQLADVRWTPLRLSLAIAWICLLFAAVAIGVLLGGVVSLSQRREAFVSAVTHELRTPLTTFRIYAEMLDEDMVDSDSQKKQYLHTLHLEANRLSHLVENVLAYARLERGRHSGQQERLSVDELLRRIVPRLWERAKQADMQLVVKEVSEGGAAVVWTDPTAVEQILFNLVDNACKYAPRTADRRVHLSAEASGRHVEIRVRDHGPGISPRDARSLFRPFSKSAQQAAVSAPGVGLGLALCRRLARQIGGDLRLEINDQPGACFCLVLPRQV